MKKVISIYQSKYELDLDTQEGRDLYAAYQLVTMFGMPATSEGDLLIEALAELTEARVFDDHPYNPSYHAAVSLCEKYNCKAAYHLAYVAYSNLPAQYRPKAIEAMARMISLGGSSSFSIYQLGLKLAKEYRFDEAVAHIKAAIKKDPHDPLYHVWLANTMVKMNEIDEALNVLYEYRKTDAYKSGKVMTFIGNQTMKQLDYTIKDIETKKARGYVYRPRKKKEV